MAAMVAGIGWQMAGIAVPLVVGWAVDQGIGGGDRTAVWWSGLALVGLGAIEAGCAAVRHRMASTAYVSSSADLREALTTAALRLDTGACDRFPPGEVLARATSDTDTVGALFDAVGHTVAEALSIPVILIALAVIDPVLAGVVAVTVPVTAVVMWRYSQVWERRSGAAQAAMGEAIREAQECIEGFKALRGLGAEPTALSRFENRSAALRDRSITVSRLWMVFEPALDALAVFSVAAVLWVGGNRVIDGSIGLGGLVAATGLVLFLAGPVRTIGERMLTIQSALASGRRIISLLEAADPAEAAATHDPHQGTVGLSLRARAVDVGRPSAGGALLVRGADLDLAPGSFTVLTGPTGSGKTAVLAVLAGLRDPHAGTVRLADHCLQDWPADALRRRLVLVGPEPFLFAGTVAENLRFAAPAASLAELSTALAVVHSQDFVGALPAGIDSLIGERGVTLSGGQRQRLALARAVLARPSVLLVDGATSALDPATEVAVLRSLCACLKETAVICVTTNAEVIGAASRVIEIRDRRLVQR